MIQPFDGNACSTTANQLDAFNRSTSVTNPDLPCSTERTIWWGSLLYPAAADAPDACLSISLIHEMSVADAPLSPFIFQQIGSSHCSHLPMSYILPQAPIGHAATGDGETNMGTVLDEANKFLCSPLFEDRGRMMNQRDRPTWDVVINPYEDERRSWHQPPVLCVAAGNTIPASDSAPSAQVSVSSDQDAKVGMATRTLYRCSCGAEYSQSQGLSRHKKDKHEPRIPCRFCASFTWSRGRLYLYKEHLQDKHSGVTHATHHAQIRAKGVRKKSHRSKNFVSKSTGHKPTRFAE